MAYDLTGINNVGEFYSHHYLDALLETDLKGIFGKWAKQKEDMGKVSPDSGLSRLAVHYYTTKSSALRQKDPAYRYVDSHDFHVRLAEVLGYPLKNTVKFIGKDDALPVLTALKRDGQEYLWILEGRFADENEVVLEQQLLEEQLGKNEEEYKLCPEPLEEIISLVFRRDEPPRWVLLMAGSLVYLIERSKWGQGRYLLFDFDEIFGRKQPDTLKAAAALLAKDNLLPDDGTVLHDQLDENSHKHAYAATGDLKYGVRRAVELLANEYVHYQREVSKGKLYDEDTAKRLTSECLTYLYRLLFIFYAEARHNELGIIPMKSDEFRLGYSLESLRDLEQVPLTTEEALNGYFLHYSLQKLFKLINEGVQENNLALVFDKAVSSHGFTMPGLGSPLFDPQNTPMLSSVKFRNKVLQEVIQVLSLSREGNGKKQRGRISYAQHGIHQLGAVYEGLLSYTGFFAKETLYEVKPAGTHDADETAQTYFVPESEIHNYNDDEFVYYQDADGSRKRRKYPPGEFIYRLAGRDREKTASYYTPHVLTECLVKYSLKELLKDKTADDILELKICEPAMGSGAFLNEAINQLARAYLERKQKELGEVIPPSEYELEERKVRTFLAMNNVYGVDLNASAIELAKVSLWLNIIYNGSKTPWFSARLAEGNSLIGARRQVFDTASLIDGSWLNKVPERAPLNEERPEATVYHFLVPDQGMAAYEKDKVIKELAKEHIERIKKWRGKFCEKFTKDEVETLKDQSKLIDILWQRYLKKKMTMLQKTSEKVKVWGQEKQLGSIIPTAIDSKDNALEDHQKPEFKCLKLIMDYWCALWFWPIEKSELLPTRDEYLMDISAILDAGTVSLTSLSQITSLPRLKMIQDVAARLKVHHWELVFTEVFIDRGGFDLILGNPPWVKVEWEEKGILSDYNPILSLRKVSASETARMRDELLTALGGRAAYFHEFEEFTGTKSFLNANYNYPLLQGMHTNVFKCFITQAWWLGAAYGLAGFLHPEGIYDDTKGGLLREAVYHRLRYHFQFINELNLFAEVDHHTKYSVNIYRTDLASSINFYHLGNLFHPSTVDACFNHDGAGVVPGIKNETFNWELRGHRNRVTNVNVDALAVFGTLYDEPGTSLSRARLPVLHSQEIMSVLRKLAGHPRSLRNLQEGFFTTMMLNETNDQKAGTILRQTRYPENSREWVLSGPHFYVVNPFSKNPNEGCKNNLDYSPINLTAIADNFLPRTNYVPAIKPDQFAKRIPRWNGQPVTHYYRQVFRRMLSPSTERTLIGCIIPPEVSHIDACRSLSFASNRDLVLFSALASSIIADFFIKSTGRSNLHNEIIKLPLPREDAPELLLNSLIARTLRLNCLTIHYAALWEEFYKPAFNLDGFIKSEVRLSSWGNLTRKWQRHCALRTDYERRQARVELDVLAVLALGLTIEELVTIYKVQFPVLQKYEIERYYDQRGMIVPKDVLKNHLGLEIEDEEELDEDNNPLPKPKPKSKPKARAKKKAEGDPLQGFIPPFDRCDREADMRQAYAHFEKLLAGEKK